MYVCVMPNDGSWVDFGVDCRLLWLHWPCSEMCATTLAEFSKSISSLLEARYVKPEIIDLEIVPRMDLSKRLKRMKCSGTNQMGGRRSGFGLVESAQLGGLPEHARHPDKAANRTSHLVCGDEGP